MKYPTLILCLLCVTVLIGSTESYSKPCGATTASTPASKASTPSLTGWGTWYCRASARREGTGGKNILMANGKPLVDTALTVAIPKKLMKAMNISLGSRVLVRSLAGNHTDILAMVTDHGPGRSSQRRGVIIDLSQAAMLALAGQDGINRGRIAVKVSKL